MVLQNPCAHFTLYQGSPPRPHHDAFLHIFQVLMCIAPASARLFLTTLCKTSAPPARIVLLLVLFFLLYFLIFNLLSSTTIPLLFVYFSPVIVSKRDL